MADRRDIARLLVAFRAGEPDAAAELHALCGPTIRAAVRRHLHPRLRARFDSTDFEQDVWASFLATPADRCAFTTAGAIRGYLARVAHNKVVETFRQRFGTQKCDIARETAGDPELAARVPSPSQWAIAGEAWEKLLGRVPPGHRAVVERLREGHDHEEIARLTGVSLSTVNRIVRRLKDLAGI
jgi:RNA polymerase sigma-70 factor (ECF subfamily)